MLAKITITISLLLIPGLAIAQFPPIINLAETTADVTIYGAQEHARAGYAVASGDFNGDGFFDIFISSDGLFPLGGTRKGEFNIIWGVELQSGGSIDLADSNNISRIFGRSDDFPLLCRATSGDFNGDNIDDIIIGEQLAGLVHVILGSFVFPDTLDLQTNPENLITIYGGPGALGAGVCACDFNGDGYDEIIISAPNTPYSEIYLIQGTDSFPGTLNMGLTEPNVTRIIDSYYYQGTGRYMTCKDIDEDGCEDLLMGGVGEIIGDNDGIVTLLYGEEILPDTISLNNSSFRIKRFYDEYSDGRLGRSLSIGDINKDGKEDIVLSASRADPLGCTDCGEVYIILDVNNLPDSIFVGTTEHSITRIIGAPPEESAYGTKVICEDLTGDGYMDIVLSSRSIENMEWTREIIVVFYGSYNPPDSIFVSTDTTISKIYSENHKDRLGGWGMVSNDYDQDGIADLALGAYSYDEGGLYNFGRVYLFFGISDPTGIHDNSIPQFVLKQNYPNPFSRSTNINYILSKSSPVSITIYNVLGQRVAQITKPLELAGPHSVTWNGLNDRGVPVSSGVYLYRLKAGAFTQMMKMIRLR